MTHISISLIVGHQNGCSFFLSAGKGRCGVRAFFHVQYPLRLIGMEWTDLIAHDWMRYLVPISARGGFLEMFWVIYALGGFWLGGWRSMRTWAGIWSQKKVARLFALAVLESILRFAPRLVGMKAFAYSWIPRISIPFSWIFFHCR